VPPAISRPFGFFCRVKSPRSGGREKMHTIRAGVRGLIQKFFDGRSGHFCSVVSRFYKTIYGCLETLGREIARPRTRPHMLARVRGFYAISERVKPAKRRGRRESDRRPKTATPTRPESRRLRRNGRPDPENATIRENANRAIPGPSKSKSAHSTRSCAHSYKRIDVYRKARHCATVDCIVGSRVSAAESANVRWNFLTVYAV